MIRAWTTCAALFAVFAGSLLVSPTDAEAGRRHRRNACCGSYGNAYYGGGWSNNYAFNANNGCCQTAFYQPAANTGCCTAGFVQSGNGSHTTGYAPQGTTTYGTNGTTAAPPPPAEQQPPRPQNDSAPPAAPEPKSDTPPKPEA